MNNTPNFDAPIGGQGMISEMGSKPWQQPAKYNTVDEALEFYSSRLQEESFQEELLDVMELGTPLSILSNSIQLGGTMQGMHTLDVGILIQPVLLEMLAFIGDKNKIKYDMGLEDPNIDPDKFPDSKIALAVKRARDKMKKEVDVDDEENVEAVADDVVDSVKGLMARR
tara:strand:+ start:169 stop:675 length:507 start_codon:yes stop_codon:yes gene_type:complete